MPFLDNSLFYSVFRDINYEILLIFFEFKLIFPFFVFALRRRSTHDQTRFIFYMVGADRLDLWILAVLRKNLFHNDITGIPPFENDKMLDRCQRHLMHLCKQCIITSHYGNICRNFIFSSWSASRIPNAIISFNPTIAVISLCSLKALSSDHIRSYTPNRYSGAHIDRLICCLMITLSFNPTASNSFRNPSTLLERCFCLVVRGGAIYATFRCPRSRRCFAIILPSLELSSSTASTFRCSFWLLIITIGIFLPTLLSYP